MIWSYKNNSLTKHCFKDKYAFTPLCGVINSGYWRNRPEILAILKECNNCARVIVSIKKKSEYSK